MCVIYSGAGADPEVEMWIDRLLRAAAVLIRITQVTNQKVWG